MNTACFQGGFRSSMKLFVKTLMEKSTWDYPTLCRTLMIFISKTKESISKNPNTALTLQSCGLELNESEFWGRFLRFTAKIQLLYFCKFVLFSRYTFDYFPWVGTGCSNRQRKQCFCIYSNVFSSPTSRYRDILNLLL